MKEDLKKLGLSNNEIKVYLSLLKIGETSVGSIINDLKIHRQIAYNALSSLENKNMVLKKTKNKINHYKVADPKIIVENLKQQELIAERLSKNIQKEMKKSRHEHEINVYSGQQQIRKYFINKYKNTPDGFDICAINPIGARFGEVLGEKILKRCEKIRTNKKITTKHIVTESSKDDLNNMLEKLDSKSRKIKVLPNDLKDPIAIVIWHDSIIFQSFFSEEPFMIDIVNDNFRDTFFEHFKMLWGIAKKQD